MTERNKAALQQMLDQETADMHNSGHLLTTAAQILFIHLAFHHWLREPCLLQLPGMMNSP